MATTADIRARTTILSLGFSILAFILLLFVYIGNTSTSPVLTKLFFIRINTEGISVNATSPEAAILNGGIAQFYQIGLWNQCSASQVGGGIDTCSKLQPAFHFSLNSIQGLSQVNEDGLLPQTAVTALKTYAFVETFLFVSYTLALISLIATVATSIFALRSRSATVLTTTWLSIGAFFALAASATATALYLVLANVINTQPDLKSHDVSSNLGTPVLVISWIGSAATLLAGILWCCCPAGKPSTKSMIFNPRDMDDLPREPSRRKRKGSSRLDFDTVGDWATAPVSEKSNEGRWRGEWRDSISSVSTRSTLGRSPSRRYYNNDYDAEPPLPATRRSLVWRFPS